MKSVTLALKAVVSSRADVGTRLQSAGDAVLIERGQPRWLLLKCPCGCGDEIPVNLDRRAGKAWRLYGGAKERLTLFPSVWRDTGCRSHFIVWRNEILLFGARDDDLFASPARADDHYLVAAVEKTWPRDGWALYVDVADQLGEIPWDVLDACRRLTRAGTLIEGQGDRRGRFKRR